MVDIEGPGLSAGPSAIFATFGRAKEYDDTQCFLSTVCVRVRHTLPLPFLQANINSAVDGIRIEFSFIYGFGRR